MGLTVAKLDQIQHVVIPRVLTLLSKTGNFRLFHLASDVKVVGCTAAPLSAGRSVVTAITLSLENGETMVVSKKHRVSGLSQPATVLIVRSWRVEKNVLLVSDDYVWERHPASTAIDDVLSAKVRDSLACGLTFVKASGLTKGFRAAQLGALHAISAHLTITKQPAVVVMPTGTGKTEVMLATAVEQRPKRLLVFVPTDALRSQTTEKFLKLGILKEIGAIPDSVIFPVVGVVKGQFKTSEEISRVKYCNVVVSTIAAVQSMATSLLSEFLNEFDMVFFDEAHHIPAVSWEKIYLNLKEQAVLQFTATPFRTDGRRVPGRIIYNFPLRLAQEQGYFRKINFVEAFSADFEEADEKIADKAVEQLREDLGAGLNHFLLARANTKARAEMLYRSIYATKFSDLNPVVIHSSMKKKAALLNAIKGGRHRIIVCVDMFGEGFDFPGLKIAAMHDIHKSLGITLQFLGRFTRDAAGIGDATIVANTADPQVADSIEELYSENPDWNVLVPELSGKAIQSQLDFSEFLSSMQTLGLSDEELFGLNVLKPKTSTVIYSAMHFNPKGFKQGLKKSLHVERSWVSQNKDLLIFITKRRNQIEWALIKDTTDIIWDLFVLSWDETQKLLFIYSSEKGTLHPELAKAVAGGEARLISGEAMFRAFHGLNRLVFHNVGLYNRGAKLRFRMYTGLDCGEVIDPATQVNSTKSNLFAIGWERGEKKSVGVSHKGRVWSMSSSSIPDWRQWCRDVAAKIQDQSLQTDEFFKHTLIPKEVARFPDKPIMTAAFNPLWYSVESEGVRVYQDGLELPLQSLEIHHFEKRGADQVELKLGFNETALSGYVLGWEAGTSQFKANRTFGPKIEIRFRNDREEISDFFEEFPPTLFFFDGSELTGSLLLESRQSAPFTYDVSNISGIDWRTTQITSESKWKGGVRRADTVQSFAIDELIRSDNSFVIDDDDSGEAADILEIKESSHAVTFRMYHCKFSHGHTPGERVKDVEVVCSQAVRSLRWINDPSSLLRHVLQREKILGGRPTRFEKGNRRGLLNLKKRLRKLKVNFEVVIVQPGLSKTALGPEVAMILGSANSFILQFTASPLKVWGSA